MIPNHVAGGTNRRDLSGKIDALCNLHVAGLERALEINVTNLLAQVGLGGDEPDQAVLNRQQDVCTLLDLLLDLSLRLNDQLLATIDMLVGRSVSHRDRTSYDVRLGRVG